MKSLLTALAFAACAGLGWWVYQDSTQRVAVKTAPPQPRTQAVEFMRMSKKTIEDRVDLVGGLEARADVELRTAVSAYVVRLLVDAGDFVQKSQVVAELDDSKLLETVSHAEAALQLAKAQHLAQQTRLTQAQKNLQRHTELAKAGVSTPQQTEDADAQGRVAKAEAELEQARVSQAESDLLNAKIALKETKIVAPMSGFVAERLVDVGDLGSPDVVLMRIVDIATVKTVVHVVERDYPKVEVGQDARVLVDSFPEHGFVGKVVRKAPVLDPLTRTAAIIIEIANRESVLKPGMHARVRLVFDRHKEAQVLPVAALAAQEEASSVFVLAGDPPQTRLTRVTTGYVDGDVVEILSGLGRRDRVVVSGGQFLSDGMTVAAVEKIATAIASHDGKTADVPTQSGD